MVRKEKKTTKREQGLRANACGIWNNNKSLFFLVNAEMAMYERIQSCLFMEIVNKPFFLLLLM